VKTRKIALLGAIAVLACVYILQLAFQAAGSIKELSLTDEPDALAIERSGGEKVSIAKDGDRWVVGAAKYPADKAKVESMLNAMKSIRILGTVSGSADYDRYGLGESGRLSVTASKNGKALRSVIAGKNSSTSEQSYALVDSGKDVLLVAGRLRDEFDKTVDALRDRTVWGVPVEGITRVDSDFSPAPPGIAGSGAAESGTRRMAFAVAKAGDPSVLQSVPLAGKSASAVDAAKAAAWVESFAALRADSFAIEGTPVDGKPLGILTVTAAGKVMTLSVLKKEGESRYLCVSSESRYPFYLQSGTVANLAKIPTEF